MAEYLSKLLKNDRVFTAKQIKDKRANSLVLTGSIGIDWATGGGIARNEMTLFWGPQGCLSGDTFIRFFTVNADGKIQCKKGGTLSHLYRRFNKLPLIGGRGFYQRKQTENSSFLINSINEKNEIIKNKINGVIYSCVKECFEVTTASGLTIQATKDHRFFDGNDYVELSKLDVGSTVFVQSDKTNKTKDIPNFYKERFLKYHPSKKFKKVVSNGITYKYCRVNESHLVIEANLNNMTVDAYVQFLNSKKVEEIEKLKVLPKGINVHHINENSLDDRLDNLQVLDHVEHTKHHQPLCKHIAIADKIVSIESVGEIETYDIQCQDPYNNFIGNGFVVHNSGKSSLMLKMLAKEQKAFPKKKAIIFDSEYSFDPIRAEALGVDISDDRLIIIQGNSFDECVTPLLKVEKDIINEKDICFIGVDSIKGFVSASLENLFEEGKAEGTATLYGGIAKTLNPLLDILMRLANEAEIMVVLTNHAAMNLDANMAKYYPFVLTGGMKVRHLCGSIIFLQKSESKASQVTGDNGVAFGGTFRVKVGKSRRTVEGKQAEVRWNLIDGEFIDQEMELAQLAKDLQIFQNPDSADKKGAKLSFKVGENLIEAKNLPDMANILKTRPALFKKVVEACNQVAINPTLGVAIADFKDDLDDFEEEMKKKGKKK